VESLARFPTIDSSLGKITFPLAVMLVYRYLKSFIFGLASLKLLKTYPVFPAKFSVRYIDPSPTKKTKRLDSRELPRKPSQSPANNSNS
jgi:hypothetical protein